MGSAVFELRPDGPWGARGLAEADPGPGGGPGGSLGDLEVDPDFCEIPAECLRAERWRLARVQQFHRGRDIWVEGARALTLGFIQVACAARLRELRQLFLFDNMSVVLAFGRNRAKTRIPLVQIWFSRRSSVWFGMPSGRSARPLQS